MDKILYYLRDENIEELGLLIYSFYQQLYSILAFVFVLGVLAGEAVKPVFRQVTLILGHPPSMNKQGFGFLYFTEGKLPS